MSSERPDHAKSSTPDASASTDAHWSEIEDLFLEALELDGSQREDRLERAEPSLRQEVRAMLRAHELEQTSAIEARLLAIEPLDESPQEVDPLVGSRVDRYEIQRELGEGGMGRVYLAHRSDDYQQDVALKVAKTGRLGEESRHRFQLERQILAKLEHPNIATLLDGGVTSDGRPYLAMQYIDGVTLDAYCDSLRLTIEQRLRLFLTVCEAVQFAHANLVVHRDLKPSNILVTTGGDVRLLDFGIAKLLDGHDVRMPNPLLETQHRLLTPLYAAPEQLSGELVTTATDVYALGVLLYRLLCGRSPYAADASSAGELELAITRTPARRPAQALEDRPRDTVEQGGPASDGEQLAIQRSTTLSSLRRQLSGDLELVLLKTLRKEPDRRYASAGQLGDDLRRLLDGQPVAAHADSLTYRLRKLAQRHPVPSALVASLAVLLVAATVVTTLQAQRLATERDRLQREQSKSQAVLGTLVDLFESSSPDRAQGETLRIEDFLASADAKASALNDEPQVQSRLLHALGRIHDARGDHAKALSYLERAWEKELAFGDSNSSEALAIQHSLARATAFAGDRDLAVTRLRASVVRLEERHGPATYEVAVAWQDLARALDLGEATPLLERALTLMRELFPADDPRVANTASDLGVRYFQAGRVEEARGLFREALETFEAALGENHPNTIKALQNHGSLVDDPEEKLATLETVRDRLILVHGAKSATLASTHNTLGVANAQLGRAAEARQAFEKAYEILLTTSGPKSEATGNTARNIARLHQLDGDYEASLLFFTKALQADLEPRRRADVLGQQAVVLARSGRSGQSVQASREGLELLERNPLASATPDRQLHLNQLRHGHVLLSASKPREASQALLEAHGFFVENSPQSMEELEAACGLVSAYHQLGEPDRATPLLAAAMTYDQFPLHDPVVMEGCSVRSASQP